MRREPRITTHDLTVSPWRAWIANSQPAPPSLLDRIRFWILGILP